MSELYDNINNPLCIKACDVNRATALTPIADADYYKFTFHVATGVSCGGVEKLKDTTELIDWLNKIPMKEFFIVDFGRYWSIYLHHDDAVVWKMRWG